MRVTQNSNYDIVRNTIHKTKRRMENLQGQSATLKKINAPSDNPSGATKILGIRTDSVNNEQFSSNVKVAEAFLNNSDHVLSELAETLVRAKEIAIGQSSGVSSTDATRFAVAEEVDQLFERALALGNTRIGNRYLFGGYKTHDGPFTDKGEYRGDDGEMKVEVGRDTFVAMNIPGIELFNTNSRTSNDGIELWGPVSRENPNDIKLSGLAPLGEENINVFDELKRLRVGLLSGDMTAVRNTLERFDHIHSHVISMRAKVGSRIMGLQGSLRAMERTNLTNAQLNTELEDADMARVMTEIAKEESILRSVLASSQKLVQPSLMDFLR